MCVLSLLPEKSNVLYWRHPLRWLLAFVLLGLVALLWTRANPLWELELAETFFTPFTCRNGVFVQELSPDRCGAFTLKWSETWNAIRDVGYKIPVIAMVLLVAWLFWPPSPDRPKTVDDVALPALGLMSVCLGPLLTVNMILKPIFGRPRPAQVDWFNGDWPYTLPGEFGGLCSGNCSFVSGEAASAFWMLWIVPFLPARWRWLGGLLILAFAICVSLLRVAFGGHFFSDVLLGGFVSAIAVCGSAWFLQSARGVAVLQGICEFYNKRFGATA